MKPLSFGNLLRYKSQLEQVTADRDEWKRQHENALASWRADVENLNKRIAELKKKQS